MAVNPVQFLVASNASITDGSKIVNISGNVDCSRVYSGTAVFLGGADNPAEAVSGTSPDGSGNSTITLRNNWSQGDVVNQQMVTFNTNEGLAEAISNVREIVSNVSAIEDLATQGLIKRIDDNNYEVVNISSQGESLITANDASSQRSVMGLGSAATKDVGTAAGNVMEVGAFGVGVNQTTIISDINAVTDGSSGFYGINNGTIGKPEFGGNTFGVVTKFPYTNFQPQLFTGSVGTGNPTAAIRVYDDLTSSFSDWLEFHHSGNTNFNEFGGNVGDTIATGAAHGANYASFELPINSTSSPAGVSVAGAFSVVAKSGTATRVASTTVNFSGADSSKKIAVVSVTSSGAFTAGEVLILRSAANNSKITVNF
ncbi:tail fiber protein [Alteromonas phage vB_AmeM_PT11-V22]|uniref:Tail fiber n=1 Tax=Alteromonas phage vB_AmeM_PT11-V22 TaxID=2704031 RepID=A0A6C0R2L1_9CAUD|nr:tail fiber protein [Alteromonas phage vB_AmeM_PT11-V22]QHZ59724.1 tail fiber [Alteromonas phage vB_AmeM_PT11-V22]